MSKILYAASVYPHLQSFHIPYIEALRAEGHEVMTLARGEGADFDVPFEKKFFSKSNKKCKQMIAKIVENNHFDVVIVNTSLAAFHIRKALPDEGRPRLVNIVHGYLFPEFASGIKGNLRRAMLLFAEKSVRSKTDALVLMNTEDLRIAATCNLTSDEPYLIDGMGVPAPNFKSNREDMRRSLGADDKFIITFVGELSRRKNQAFLIKAMPKILEKIPNAELLLVGEGASRDELCELIAELGLTESVKLLGKRDDVADVLSATDVYAAASKSEGLPFNVVEAVSVGCTVVASRVKGHEDILADGAGFLFEADNYDEYIDTVMGIHDGKYSVSPEATAEAWSRFCFDNVFPETYAVIKEAARL